MCQRVSCSKCGKPTFTGCGAHVEQVLGDVPKAERCQCGQKKGDHGDDAGGGSGWLRNLFK